MKYGSGVKIRFMLLKEDTRVAYVNEHLGNGEVFHIIVIVGQKKL